MTDESPSVDASEPGVAPVAAGKAPHRRWYRLALLITLLLVALTLVTVPTTLTSMGDVLGRAPDPVYDLLTGRQVTGAEAAAAAADAIYVNLGLVDLNEGSGLHHDRRLRQSQLCGHLPDADPDADRAGRWTVEQRRGLPPSATLTLAPADRVFSQSVQLPVSGQPSRYPFDDYLLWLGVAGVATEADGTIQPTRPGHGGRGGDDHGAEPHLRSGHAAPRPDRPQAQSGRPPTRPRSSPCSPCGSSARPTSSACR